MIKGLTTALKPCLKKIIINNANLDSGPESRPGNFSDLYYDTPEIEAGPLKAPGLKLTFDFNIKSKFNNIVLKDIKKSLAGVYLSWAPYTNKNLFLQLLGSSAATQDLMLESKLPTVCGELAPCTTSIYNPNSTLPLSDYIYYGDVFKEINPETGEYEDVGKNMFKYLNIPVECGTYHYPSFLDVEDSSNPPFLAYVFSLVKTTDQKTFTVLPNTLTSEVLFDGAVIPSQTGFFTISTTFGHNGAEHSLYETELSTDHIDPITGEAVGSAKPTNLVEQVNKFYGAPGDIWIGPIHMNKVTTPGPNFGKLRAMGGAIHTAQPHPFLDYNLKSNNKIIDFRSFSKLENMFAYNADGYEKLLAGTSDVLFTGGKKKNTIDELISKIAIVSKAHYSIRPTADRAAFQSEVPNSVVPPPIPRLPGKAPVLGPEDKINVSPATLPPRDSVHFLFAIDKTRLLKETTKLPGLLDALARVNASFLDKLVNSINIFYFAITRINKNTKEHKTLLTGMNDLGFNDDNSFSASGKIITKGFKFKNKTATIKINNKRNLSFYEFTDGELDASGYDSNTYTYKISLKFKDPLIEYMSARLDQARAVISDLDELLSRTEMKMFYKLKGKLVNIFDTYQNQFNPQFIEEAMAGLGEDFPPLSFGFDQDSQVPESVEDAFKGSVGLGAELDSLTILLISLNAHNELEPWKDFAFTVPGLLLFADTIQYIKNSLRLSTTNPTLIEKVRSLVSLIENRLTRSLELYTTENITKKDVGFTFDDYIKATNAKNAGSYITEFDYTFNNSIDLSKVKNHFNWVAKPDHVAGPGGIKTITSRDYINLVTSARNLVLSQFGQQAFKTDQFDATGIPPEVYSYSFIPVNAAYLKLFNSGQVGFDIKDHQTIRQKLFDRITHSPESVTIPELLSFFGIKFTNDSILQITADQLADLGSGIKDFEDNFGEPFDPKDPVADVPKDFVPGFGSVKDPEYEWQGGTLASYPLLLAKSLINIINTDNSYKDKNLDSLRDIYLNGAIGTKSFVEAEGLGGPMALFGNKEVPFEINLFSTKYAIDPNFGGAPHVNNAMLNYLFNSNGDLNYDNYTTYLFFLSLFGKVHYLQSFEEGAIDDPSYSKLTPTSYRDRILVGSSIWAPISRSALETLEPGRQLFCKVQLFEGASDAGQGGLDYSPLLDMKTVNLFKKHYNYNRYFFISGVPLTPGELGEWDGRDFELEREKMRIEENERIKTEHKLTEHDIRQGEDLGRRAGEPPPDDSGRAPPRPAEPNALRRQKAREIGAKRAAIANEGVDSTTKRIKNLVNIKKDLFKDPFFTE